MYRMQHLRAWQTCFFSPSPNITGLPIATWPRQHGCGFVIFRPYKQLWHMVDVSVISNCSFMLQELQIIRILQPICTRSVAAKTVCNPECNQSKQQYSCPWYQAGAKLVNAHQQLTVIVRPNLVYSLSQKFRSGLLHGWRLQCTL